DVRQKGEGVDLSAPARPNAPSPCRDPRTNGLGHLGLAIDHATLRRQHGITLAPFTVRVAELPPAQAGPDRAQRCGTDDDFPERRPHRVGIAAAARGSLRRRSGAAAQSTSVAAPYT